MQTFSVCATTLFPEVGGKSQRDVEKKEAEVNHGLSIKKENKSLRN